MTRTFILEGKIPKPIENVIEWGRWFETADRCVGNTKLPNNVRVSTVFLGFDHSFVEGAPLLFETMVFGKCKFDNYQERYSTWEEAQEGHLRAVKLAKGGMRHGR